MCHVRRVEQQQYRVDVSDSKKESATVQCHFSRTRDLMFVLLPREARLLPLRRVGVVAWLIQHICRGAHMQTCAATAHWCLQQLIGACNQQPMEGRWNAASRHLTQNELWKPHALHMQLALFDLELQQPAASTKLSASRPAFTAILGSCGHDGAEHRSTDGGVDLVYCLHQVCMCKMLPMRCCVLHTGRCLYFAVLGFCVSIPSNICTVCSVRMISLVLAPTLPLPKPMPAFSTLQDTSLSVWRRQRGELTYTSLCYHKLTPPPSRLSNNASITVCSAAACLWRPTAESGPTRGALCAA